MKIKIKIQSISDLITNSSSEVFCRINSDDPEIKKQILGLLEDLIPGDDMELEPVVRVWDDEIVLELPNDYWSAAAFYRAGLEAILKEKFGEQIILLCRESIDEFCHRRLWADFIELETGIYIPEVTVSNDGIVKKINPIRYKNRLKDVVNK